MDLTKYPLDSHACQLQIGSFGYTAEDMLYRWAKPKGVSIADNVEMAQFRLVNYKTFTNTKPL